MCRYSRISRYFADTGVSLQANGFACCCSQNWQGCQRQKRAVSCAWDMKNVITKVTESGNPNVIATERGTSFGYNTLVTDFRGIPTMAAMGVPVIFDATHSVQQPGGQGGSSGGQREFVPVLACAAIAVGVAGLFIETHQDPDTAPSDGPNMIPLHEMRALLQKLKTFDAVAKN
jgi:2-dehydro-3-deoxyphosphooctonate aldolase (KDO 8-P synthase)